MNGELECFAKTKNSPVTIEIKNKEDEAGEGNPKDTKGGKKKGKKNK